MNSNINVAFTLALENTGRNQVKIALEILHVATDVPFAESGLPFSPKKWSLHKTTLLVLNPPSFIICVYGLVGVL